MTSSASDPLITFDFVENLVRQKESSNSVHLKSYKVENALGKSENYCSQLFRIIAVYTDDTTNDERQTNFISKSNLVDADLLALMENANLFVKEVAAYGIVLPAVRQLLDSINETDQIMPKCIASSIEEEYLVFEDLSCRGFRNADKRQGLDATHLKLTLKALAKWHASTAVLHTKNKALLDHFAKPFHYANVGVAKALYDSFAKAASIACSKWKGFEEIGKKLSNWNDDKIEAASLKYYPRPNRFNVLTHGDLWCNNVMYRYSEKGQPVEALLIDFNLCIWGNPGMDLLFFLCSSSQDDLQEAEWTELIQFYHTELVNLLKQMQYPGEIPSLIDIHTDMLQTGMCPVLSSLFNTSIRKKRFDDDGIMDFIDTNNSQTDNGLVKVFMQPECEPRLQYLVKYFDRKDYFDSLIKNRI